MARQLTILVFVNTEPLGKRRYLHEARSELLRAGVARLQREVPYVTILTPNPAAAAVPVQVDEDKVGDFVAYLDGRPNWVTYEFDGAGMFRAAKG